MQENRSQTVIAIIVLSSFLVGYGVVTWPEPKPQPPQPPELAKLVFWKFVDEEGNNAMPVGRKFKPDNARVNPWAMEGSYGSLFGFDGMSRATVCYPRNIRREQWKHLRDKTKRLPPMFIRKAARNVALGKPVTATRVPFGKMQTLTDGDIHCISADYVFSLTAEEAEGYDIDSPSAIMIDLGSEYDVEAIAVWHNYKRPVIYEGVIVQVSTDKDFAPGKTTTIFNNDYDDFAGFGEGKDKLYPASVYGELIRAGHVAKGLKARYVRVITEGVLNDISSPPAFLEVGVYALPKPIDTKTTEAFLAPMKARRRAAQASAKPVKK